MTVSAWEQNLPELDEGMEAFLAVLASTAVPANTAEISVAKMRASAAALRKPWNAGGPSMAETVEFELSTSTGEMRARLYRPADGPISSTLIYLHGGGWTLLNIDTHDRLMREYAAASGWAVVGLDYPLAPEIRYPQTLDICLHAYRVLLARLESLGVKPEQIVVGGDSSGANLAVSLAIMLRDAGASKPAGLLLNYGVYDCDLTAQSYTEFSVKPYQLNRDRMSWFWNGYCPDVDRRLEPLASPLRAPLDDLPPAYLVVAGQDVLRDENLAFHSALITAGNRASIALYSGAPHAFLEALAFSKTGHIAIERTAEWLRTISNIGREP